MSTVYKRKHDLSSIFLKNIQKIYVEKIGEMITEQARILVKNYADMKKQHPDLLNAVYMVEVTGFEPAASSSRTKRSTKLSHTSIFCCSLSFFLDSRRQLLYYIYNRPFCQHYF